MSSTKEYIEKIEGEANLELFWENGKIDFAKIKFYNFRGIEKILIGKQPLDAIAITPRICGICCNAHTLVTVKTLENIYENLGINLEISKKARAIREIVLNSEKIQNHIKWFYSAIVGTLSSDNKSLDLYVPLSGKKWFQGINASTNILKIAALFGGQWPHSSFAIVGGVMCDPTNNDISQAVNLIDQTIDFLEDEIFGLDINSIVESENYLNLTQNNSLYSQIVEILKDRNFHKMGKSHDRFLTLGDFSIAEGNKAVNTRIYKAQIKYVTEDTEDTFFEKGQGYGYNKSAMYKGKYYETGPLARMIISQNSVIRDLHRKYKDSSLTRISARVIECAHILLRTKKLLMELDLKEQSYIEPTINIKDLEGYGEYAVEASRGTLIHKIEIKKSRIFDYDIITPTVFNLGNGTKQSPSIGQQAIMGIENFKDADFVFKSFDLCAVCTTQ